MHASLSNPRLASRLPVARRSSAAHRCTSMLPVYLCIYQERESRSKKKADDFNGSHNSCRRASNNKGFRSRDPLFLADRVSSFLLLSRRASEQRQAPAAVAASRGTRQVRDGDARWRERRRQPLLPRDACCPSCLVQLCPAVDQLPLRLSQASCQPR